MTGLFCSGVLLRLHGVEGDWTVLQWCTAATAWGGG